MPVLEPLESRFLLTGGPIISEFMAENTHTLADQQGDYSDWIEIRNTGPDVNLAEWHLTDDPANLSKWEFPDAPLPAGGYLVVFASGKDTVISGEIHANFSLDAAGEYLALVQPNGTTVASEFAPEYPPQKADVSYGLQTDTATTTLLAAGASGRATVPTGTIVGWNTQGFVDTSWTPVTTGVGFDRSTFPVAPGTANYYYGPYGPGGSWHLYQVVTSAKTWWQANTDAQGRTQGGVAGHLVTVTSAGENAFVKSVIGSTTSWIGLTDSTALGGTECGNTSGLSLPASGVPPTTSQRGGGFVWVTGEPFIYPNWASGQPDDINSSSTAGADAVEMQSAGTWSDNKDGEPGQGQDGRTRAYVVEYDLNLGNWSVLEAHGGTLSNITSAINLLAGGGTTYPAAVLNSSDPQNAAGGQHFANDAPFYGNTAAVDANWALAATGYINIASTGTYTFDVNSDDGFRLIIDGAQFTAVYGGGTTINGGTMEFATGRSAADSLGVTDLTAGLHKVTLYYYQGTGGSGLEFSAASGAKTAWDSTFKLVGDTMNGGLAMADVKDLVAADIGSAMYGVNASAYIRIPFTVADPSAYDGLTLRMTYDDGFVAYVNGQFACSAAAPATPAWNSAATGQRPDTEAVGYQDFNISSVLGSLVSGTNILAIQGLNVVAGDADFLALPELRAFTTAPVDDRYFLAPTPRGPNNDGVLGFVADTRFSQKRGFYTAPFSLAILSDTLGATIRYTTDGSAPTPTTGAVYTAPIPINKTTVVRAIAYKDGYGPTNVDTETYIFLSDVLTQATDPQNPLNHLVFPVGYPANWSGHTADYQMDPEIVTDPAYSGLMTGAMTSIPTLSIVMNEVDMFGQGGTPATQGIYTYPLNSGDAWQRPASIEWIYPDGTTGFQTDAGIEIQGGGSRDPQRNPKHAFRLIFNHTFGPGDLNFRLFDGTTVHSFGSLSLRTEYNNGWEHWDGVQRSRGTSLRDAFARDTQLAMGDLGTHGTFVHLYINGMYWGLYAPTERPDGQFAADYLGGAKEEYDAIHCTQAGQLNVVDGDLAAWTAMMNLANTGYTDAGHPFDSSALASSDRYQQVRQYLDVAGLADYMIVMLYTANWDWPAQNWSAVRKREAGAGFKFLVWDSERIMESVADNRTGVSDDNTPARLYSQLRANPEFRLLFADRVQKFFFNDGALTPAAADARWTVRANEIDQAIIAESARWGDYRRDIEQYSSGPYDLFTRDNQWTAQQDWLHNTYFPQRSDVMVKINPTTQLPTGQFVSAGLYPGVTAPALSQFGGLIHAGYNLEMTAPAGTIYYTLDGSDPRVPVTGAVSPTALVYTGPITLADSRNVKARVLNGSTWSALDDATFILDQPPVLRVTEVMYHPQDPPVGSTYADTDFQYVELQNTGAQPLSMLGMKLSGAVDYTFPDMSLAAGERILVVANRAAFESRYGLDLNIAGEFTGTLSKNQAEITLASGLGTTIQDFTYHDGWYPDTDGEGFSLVVRDSGQDLALWNSKDGWRPSETLSGGPGVADPGIDPDSVVINELLAHTDSSPLGDWVEFKNTTASPINIGGWYFSDDPANLMKYRIPDDNPADTTVPAGGYLVFNQLQDPLHAGMPYFGFGFGETGGAAYLSESQVPGVLCGYREIEDFGGSDREVSFGRYIKSTGGEDFVAMTAQTRGAGNAYPVVGPVVLNELMYKPAGLTDYEFIEMRNLTDSLVLLYDAAKPVPAWKFTDGVTYTFTAGAIVPADGYALVVGIDPAAFRTRYGIPAQVPIYGPYTGALNDAGETVELQRPEQPDGTEPYIRADRVTYGVASPWPVQPAGGGVSLERRASGLYGNDVANWAAGPAGGTPGAANIATRPTVDIQATVPNAAEQGEVKGTVTVTRTGDLTAALTVNYAVGGTAGPGDYHENLAGSVTIPVGLPSTTIDITPADDGENEFDETVMLTLLPSAAYDVGTSSAATVTIADNELARVVGVKLNGSASRGLSAVDPSGRGVQTIEVRFSEPVTFAPNDATVQTVRIVSGAEQVVATLVPTSVTGLGSDTMVITLPDGAAVDTWVKVALSGSGALEDLQDHLLDGEPRSGGSGRGYVYNSSDLPTGNGVPGGSAVFYVGSLRGDYNGDFQVTPGDLAGFAAAFQAGDPDADLRGVGFGSNWPDGQVTVEDIDAFAATFQQAMASPGSGLGDLPLQGVPAADEVVEVVSLPVSGRDPAQQSAAPSEVDLLAAAVSQSLPQTAATITLPASDARTATPAAALRAKVAGVKHHRTTAGSADHRIRKTPSIRIDDEIVARSLRPRRGASSPVV